MAFIKLKSTGTYFYKLQRRQNEQYEKLRILVVDAYVFSCELFTDEKREIQSGRTKKYIFNKTRCTKH